MSRFFIYVLHRAESNCVYVGMTQNGMKRPKDHGRAWNMKHNAHYPVVGWIKKYGRDYEITILEEFADASPLEAAEIFYIAYFKSIGMRLLNCTEGGDGRTGLRWSKEQREAISRRNTGAVFSAEHRFNLSKAKLGQAKHSDETRAKIGKKLKGRSPTKEQLAKRSIALLKIPTHVRKHGLQVFVAWRQALKLSQKQVARLLNLGLSTVARFEQGRTASTEACNDIPEHVREVGPEITRAWRLSLGLSQRAANKLLGLPHGTLQRFES